MLHFSSLSLIMNYLNVKMPFSDPLPAFFLTIKFVIQDLRTLSLYDAKLLQTHEILNKQHE